jgi:hypothetical protein
LAAYAELTIEQGANLTSYVTVSDDSGYPINLQFYTAASQLRKSYYSSTYTPLNATVTGIANGQITLSMTAANTANLNPGRYVYDLNITNSLNNSVMRVVEGTAVILPAVTNSYNSYSPPPEPSPSSDMEVDGGTF